MATTFYSCPDCGAQLQYGEGCSICPYCGWSSCGRTKTSPFAKIGGVFRRVWVTIPLLLFLGCAGATETKEVYIPVKPAAELPAKPVKGEDAALNLVDILEYCGKLETVCKAHLGQ